MDISASRCCTPSRPSTSAAGGQSPVSKPAHGSTIETVVIPGGTPVLGTRRPRIANDGEELRASAPLNDFRMSTAAITNAQFAEFVEATGYVTEAERFGWSFVFWSDVPETIPQTHGVVGLEWWRRVDGANWRDINGPCTRETAWFPDHPVVQVSWNDAVNFSVWTGGRLPTECEWEHAARGGRGDVPYPWGETEPDDTGPFVCNIWQGDFPRCNSGADGYRATAPARAFDANGFGLHNLVGNVWEWTADPFHIESREKAALDRLRFMQGYRTAKGGSYLCHRSYCWRYRIAARIGNAPDSTTPHMGFRVVFDIPNEP